MNKQDAAKIRAQTQGKIDPMFFKKLGKKGGKVSGVKKGAATLTLEQRKELSRKGLEKRWGKNEKAN